MHPRILAQRQAVAYSRIQERATAIAEKAKMDPELLGRLQATGIRDTNVANLTRIEAVADFMDLIAPKYGVEVPAVEVHQLTEFIAPAPEPEQAQESQVIEGKISQPPPKPKKTARTVSKKKK